MAETKYGGTVTSVKRKRVPGSGSSYSKTTRAKACGRSLKTANKLQSDGISGNEETEKLAIH